jgi:two-component system CheB/CheR fusion protein
MQSLSGTSVLVVEDDPETLALYVARLEQLGAAVNGATDAPAALSILAVWRPDVMLCDLHLPGMDGYQLMEQIRARPELAGVPVIAISGSHPALVADRCLREGFVELLTKPVRFARVVESILKRGAAARGLSAVG